MMVAILQLKASKLIVYFVSVFHSCYFHYSGENHNMIMNIVVFDWSVVFSLHLIGELLWSVR